MSIINDSAEPNKLPFYLNLWWIITAGFALRLIAVFFSGGYAFSDDHFTVIEPAQAWVNGIAYWIDRPQPPLHSMLYASIHAVIFYLQETLGIYDPKLKMLLVRLLHAVFSLWSILLCYRLSWVLSKGNIRAAAFSAWLMSALWAAPFLSVRNAVEWVCIPFVLAGFLVFAKAYASFFRASDKLINEPKVNLNFKDMLWAGFWWGLAFSFRYHTALFVAGACLVLLAQRQMRAVLSIALGFFIAAFIGIASFDVAFFDYPFQSLVWYVRYNLSHSGDFPNGPFYQFAILLILGLVPPLSIALLWGWLRSVRFKLLLPFFAASLLFFLFHSIFPNKQERFIIPMLPLVFIISSVVWFKTISTQRILTYTFIKVALAFVIILNTIALGITATSHLKQPRIESLYTLGQLDDVKGIVFSSPKSSTPLPPAFYYNNKHNFLRTYRHWYRQQQGISTPYIVKDTTSYSTTFLYALPKNKPIDSLLAEVKATHQPQPNYFVLFQPKDIDSRIAALEAHFGKLQILYHIPSAGYDKLLHTLNPKHNPDDSAVILKSY